MQRKATVKCSLLIVVCRKGMNACSHRWRVARANVSNQVFSKMEKIDAVELNQAQWRGGTLNWRALLPVCKEYGRWAQNGVE